MGCPHRKEMEGKSRGAEGGKETKLKTRAPVLLERQRSRSRGVAGSRVLME